MQVFKEWCSGEKNSLIIPGYCVAGTLGNKLLSGAKKVKVFFFPIISIRSITRIMKS